LERGAIVITALVDCNSLYMLMQKLWSKPTGIKRRYGIRNCENNIFNHGINPIVRHTMSSNIPFIVDPEVPTGLARLADTVFKLEVTDVPEDVWSHLPHETAPILTKSQHPDPPLKKDHDQTGLSVRLSIRLDI
jgi:hypothetical protein